tara:strand:+ start:366 stop:659 length:294 start_codon:yes stop_codon:yes gene_type:complete
MSNTEKLMRKYPMLSAAWDECSMIWQGIEQNGTVHKFNRRVLLSNSMESKSGRKVDDRFIGGKDKMIRPVGEPGSDARIEALCNHYVNTVEESPFLE